MLKIFRSRILLAAALVLSTAMMSQSQTGPAKPAKPAASTAASGTLLDINTATADQLKAFSGIGDAYSARIIAGRPYTAKNQLLSRGILPTATYNKIKDQIIASKPKK